jgi:hypothetical protein
MNSSLELEHKGTSNKIDLFPFRANPTVKWTKGGNEIAEIFLENTDGDGDFCLRATRPLVGGRYVPQHQDEYVTKFYADYSNGLSNYRAGLYITPTLNFTKANRTLSVVNNNTTIFVKNETVDVETDDSIVIPDVEGNHYVWYNETGTLITSQVKPNGFYTEYCSVAIVYWNAVNKEAEYITPCGYSVYYSAKGERLNQRETVRKQYGGVGLAPTNLQVDVSDGSITDDDLKFTVENGRCVDGTNISVVDAFSVFPAQIPVGFLLGTEDNPIIRTKVTDTFPILLSTSKVQYNPVVGGDFVLQDVPYGDFVLYTYFQLDTSPADGIAPLPLVFGVPSHLTYPTVVQARNNADDELSRLQEYEIIREHGVALFTIIVESTNNSSTYNCRYRSVDSEGNKFVDLRGLKGTAGVGGSAINDHNLLNGLQGGTTTERNHLTNEQVDRVNSALIEVPNISAVLGAGNDAGGQLIKNIGNAIEDGDALNRITADGRYGLSYSNPLASLNLSGDPTSAIDGVTTFGDLAGTIKWYGGVLAPNGKIYAIPHNSTQVLEIDPVAQTVNTFGNLVGTGKWVGGVLAPNGKIFGIPANSTQILEIDPVAQTTTLFGDLNGINKWVGGVLAPNGKIYGIPYNSTQILEIDPVAQTTTLFGSNLPGTGKWVGGVLAPNGKIYGIPRDSTSILEIIPPTTGYNWWALSNYVNKF